MRALIILSCFCLAGCATSYEVKPNYALKPSNQKKGLMAISLSCNGGISPRTRNLLHFHDTDSSTLGRVFNADTVSFLKLNCSNAKTHYAMQALPAGTYAFFALTLNQITAGFHLFFTVTPNQVTYIGHLAIKSNAPITANDVRFDTLNAGVIHFRLSNHAKQDIAYFRRHYPNIHGNAYRVKIAKLSG